MTPLQMRQRRLMAGVGRRPTLQVSPPNIRQRPADPRPSLPTSSTRSSFPIETEGDRLAASRMRKPIASGAFGGTVPSGNDDGGSTFGRGLGFIINNPLTRGAVDALQVLDYPRRLAMLGIEQAAVGLPEWAETATTFGLANLVDEDKVREDERSNLEKLQDPEFGFGQITGETGNEWLDRIIGFTGDVALDPLTYVAGLGFAGKAGTVGGKAARAGAVQRAVDKGYDAERAAEALRKGFGFADKELLEKAGVEGGIRVGLPLQRGRVIPGTEKLVRPFSKARGATAAGFNARVPGKALMNTRAPKGLEESYRNLFAGEGTGIDIPVSLERVALEDERKLAEGMFQGRAQRETNQVRRMLRKEKSPKQRRDMLRQTETTDEDNPFRQALDRLWDIAGEFGINTERRLSRYSPHIATREGREWLINNEDRAAGMIGVASQELYQPSGVTMARGLRKGEYIPVGDEFVEITDDSVEGLNKLFREKYGLTFDMFESDPSVVLDKYINMLAQDVGWAGAITQRAEKGTGDVLRALTPDERRLLGIGEGEEAATGVFRGGQARPRGDTAKMAGEGDVRLDMVTAKKDKGATESLNKQMVEGLGEQINEARRERTATGALISAQAGDASKRLSDDLLQVRDFSAEEVKRLNQALDEVGAEVDEARRAGPEALANYESTMEQLEWMRTYVRDRRARLDRTLERSLPAERRKVIDRLRGEYEALGKRMETLVPGATQAGLLSRSADELADQALRPTREAGEALDEFIGQARVRSGVDAAQRRAGLTRLRLREYLGERGVDSRETMEALERIETRRAAELKLLDDEINEAAEAARAAKAKTYKTPKAAEQAQRKAFDRLEQAVTKRTAEAKKINAKADEQWQKAYNKVVRSRQPDDIDPTALETLKAAADDASREAAEASKRFDSEVRQARREYEEFARAQELRPVREVDPQRIQDAGFTQTPAERLRREDPGDMPAMEAARRLRRLVDDSNTAEIRRGAQTREEISGRLAENVTEPGAERGKRAFPNAPFMKGLPKEAPETIRTEAARPIRQRQEPAREALRDIDKLRRASIEMGQPEQYLEQLAEANEQLTRSLVEMSQLLTDRQAMKGTVDEIEEMLRRKNLPIDTGTGRTAKVSPIPAKNMSMKGKGQPATRRFISEQQQVADEMRAVAEQAKPYLDEGTYAATIKLLDDNDRLLTEMGETAKREYDATMMRGEARKNQAARVMTVTLADGWQSMTKLIDAAGLDGVVMRKELNDQLTALYTASMERKFWPVIDTFTNLFKTYATLTPGFHVRNAMSAVFMNSSDNVPVATQARAAALAKRMGRAAKKGNFEEFWNGLSDIERMTIEGSMGTGMGGFFAEHGVGKRGTTSRAVLEYLFENPATEASKRFGSFVEAAVRMPVVMDTLQQAERAGLSLDEAMMAGMQRARRLHFDYSQVSTFDEKAKRFIPFWTFMSRNLPLQVSQMWTKPRAYAKYNSFIRNFRGDDEPGTPDYFSDIGAFRFGNTPFYLSPDFAHTQLNEDIQSMGNFVGGSNRGRFLTQFNPLITAPIELTTGKDLFTGRTFSEEDVRKIGLAERPIQPLLEAMGAGKSSRDGTRVYEEGGINFLRSLIPLYDRAIRLGGPAVTGGGEDDASQRVLESWLRAFGAPVRQVSDAQRRNQLRGEMFDRRDQWRVQQAVERAATA